MVTLPSTPMQAWPRKSVVPPRHWVGTPPYVDKRELWQSASDAMLKNRQKWFYAAWDACAPTCLCFFPAVQGGSPRLSIWVGPVDVALDGEWLRFMEVAYV